MSRPPLVLAIEPDLRQAAIVKRIVKERVQADVVVVDSRDAAIEAIRAAIPDVVLVSALLSPRDEDDLISHLRTLEDAAHLQTHTIPQLASTLGPGENGGGGLLSAFRRKKQPATAPSGCDPDLFADEIRVFLERAAEKKRQAAESGTGTPLPSLARKAFQQPASLTEQAAEPSRAQDSSWASPFEWRPTSDRRIAPPPEGSGRQPEAAIAAEPFVAEPFVPEPYVPESFVPDPEPVVDAAPIVPEPEPEPAPPVAIAPPPVVKIHEPAPFEVWARRETPAEAPAETLAASGDDLNDLLARLGVPESVASVSYPQGVRIRRLRVLAAKDSHSSLHGAVVLSRRLLAELRGSDARA